MQHHPEAGSSPRGKPLLSSASRQPLLGLVLAVLPVVYHSLVYATGGRLLTSR